VGVGGAVVRSPCLAVYTVGRWEIMVPAHHSV